MKKILSSLALSFSLSFAYTAADVYGVWNTSGKLEATITYYWIMEALIESDISIKGSDFSAGGEHFRFSKDDFNDKWRFSKGVITFPSSYTQCQLISNKVMDCDIPTGYGNFQKKTLKKAGTIAQLEAQLKKEAEKEKQNKEKKRQEEERQKLEKEKQKQEEEKQAEASRKEFSYETFNFGGEDYPTIKVGNAVWMAKNLNLPADNSVCYDKKPENCEKYGRLYNWETAKKACPSGWHLPSDAEWKTLEDYIEKQKSCTKCAGKYLKATSGWNDYNGKSGNGTDDFGFAALPGGYGTSDGDFDYVGDSGYWWSASENTAYRAYYRSMYYGGWSAGWSSSSKTSLFSVRCVKD